MRTLIALASLATSARVCGGEAPPPPVPPPVVVAAPTTVMAPGIAKHGGTVVVVDDVQLELVMKGSGEVAAYPVEVSGGVIVPPTATVQVDVPVTVGPPRPVQLVWNPAVASFEGRVVGATIAPAPAVEVRVVHAGRIRHARTTRVILVPSTVVVTGPRADVELRRPGVLIAPPSVDVRVNVPTVRFGVEVEGGYDDHHHHGMHDNGRHLGWDMGPGMHGMHR